MRKSGTLDNCIFWGNTDVSGAGESAQIHLAGATVNINYSCVDGWTGTLGGVGNTGADPRFLDDDGTDNTVGTSDDDLRLSPGSSAIDAADNTAVPADANDIDGDGDTTEPLPLGCDGAPRFADDGRTPDTGNGVAPIVDMGAYEFHGIPTSLLGDMNCDGFRDIDDVGPFTLALLDPAQYANTYPNCQFARADVNADGQANGLDVGAFIALLLGP